MNKKKIIIIIFLLIFICIGFIFYYFLDIKDSLKTIQCETDIREVTVRGNSLKPFLNDGDEVKVDYAYYKCGKEVKRGDLVIYDFQANDQELIKFVKAIPRDSFHVDEENDVLLINDEIMLNAEGEEYKLNEQNQKMLKLYEESFLGSLPGTSCLIFGNETGVIDSGKFGPVSAENILGKVLVD